MERKFVCLFAVGLLMVASLIESEACKKCGNPMCNGFGIGGLGGLGGHPLLGGLAGHPLLGGGFGGNPVMTGNPMMGINPMMGGSVGYPVPYPVAVPVPMASPYPHPYSSPYLELRSMGPIDGGYFEDDCLPRRRMCRCQLQGYRGSARKQNINEGRSRGDD